MNVLPRPAAGPTRQCPRRVPGWSCSAGTTGSWEAGALKGRRREPSASIITAFTPGRAAMRPARSGGMPATLSISTWTLPATRTCRRCPSSWRQLVQQRLLVLQDQVGRRPLHLADKNARGHGGDHALAGSGQFVGQAEHDGRLAAAAHDGDDLGLILALQAQGLRDEHSQHSLSAQGSLSRRPAASRPGWLRAPRRPPPATYPRY